MKATAIALVALAGGVAAPSAFADPGHREHSERHCSLCVRVKRWERCDRTEQRLAGYRDVMVDQQITEYEMREVSRRVQVGTDGCGQPVYETRTVCERVPVTRTVRVCEKQPFYETVSIPSWRQVFKYVCALR